MAVNAVKKIIDPARDNSVDLKMIKIIKKMGDTVEVCCIHTTFLRCYKCIFLKYNSHYSEILHIVIVYTTKKIQTLYIYIYIYIYGCSAGYGRPLMSVYLLRTRYDWLSSLLLFIYILKIAALPVFIEC
uniref:VHS domain-containing protein n=1 Tax=Heterorhabditis bacteriophora TaxID=37862 RepID=A0A1I7WZB6_HETBA